MTVDRGCGCSATQATVRKILSKTVFASPAHFQGSKKGLIFRKRQGRKKARQKKLYGDTA